MVTKITSSLSEEKYFVFNFAVENRQYDFKIKADSASLAQDTLIKDLKIMLNSNSLKKAK